MCAPLLVSSEHASWLFLFAPRLSFEVGGSRLGASSAYQQTETLPAELRASSPGRGRYFIASAFGGEPTPPRKFSGADVKKNS